MGVILCKCYQGLCSNDCLPTGFALIKMAVPEECKPTTVLDLSTGLSYPQDAVFKAEITEDGCWYSCELPFSDMLFPPVSYEIVEVLAGSCGDACDCDVSSNCGCPNYCAGDEYPTCSVWIDSKAGHPEPPACVSVTSLCGAPTPDGTLTCKDPKCIPVEMSELCLNNGIEPVGLSCWFAPGNGYLDVQFASIPSSINVDLDFVILKRDSGESIFSGTIPAGMSMIDIRDLDDIWIEETCGLCLDIITDLSGEPEAPGVFTLQSQFSYCPGE